MPNDLRTAKRVVESIQDDLNEEDHCEHYVCLLKLFVLAFPIRSRLRRLAQPTLARSWHGKVARRETFAGSTRPKSKPVCFWCEAAWTYSALQFPRGDAWQSKRRRRFARLIGWLQVLHLRRLVRSWQSVSRVRSVADACKRLPEVPQLIVKYQKYQQQQMAKFIHQRMLRLRAACMSRANWVRCMARAGKKALHEWQRVSRMSALERSVSYQERTHWQSWLRHAFESFVEVAASAKVVRSKALDLQKRWLARVLLAFQEATRCSKAFRHRCRAAQATFRKRQLERSMEFLALVEAFSKAAAAS